MRDVPVLLRGPLVLAFLSGQKTVTRRTDLHKWRKVEPGDRIWFKETHQFPGGLLSGREGGGFDHYVDVRYRADGDDSERVRYLLDEETWIKYNQRGQREQRRLYDQGKDAGLIYTRWRPSIFMPKWAARCWALVEDVREERLQDITEEDARAEGVKLDEDSSLYNYRQSFFFTWDEINGDKDGLSYSDNPTVARVQFRRIEVPR